MKRLFCFLLFVSVLTARAQQFFLIAGTYTNSGNAGGNAKMDSTGSKGLYVYRFDAATGKTKLLSHTEGVCNPSYFTVAPDGHHVYACTESRMTGRGSVSAFELDRVTGRLRLINKVPSGGDNPAYISIDPSGKWVIVANYTGGSFVVCSVRPDGGLLPAVQRIVFSGHGVNPQRQEKSHVHSAVLSPDGRHLYIQDLGLDRVTELPFDVGLPLPAGTGGLEQLGEIEGAQPDRATRRLSTVPGSGPRHLTFSPDGHFADLVEEMGGMVDVYRYDPVTGGLDSVQRIAAHPDTAAGPFRSADIHFTPDGRFLYVTNRAEGTLAIFGVGRDGANQAAGQSQAIGQRQAAGVLWPVGYESVFGKEPRNFVIDPTGSWLLAADQESDRIVVYRRDRETGLLTPLKRRIDVPRPTCLRIVD